MHPNPAEPNKAASTLLEVIGGAFVVNAIQGIVVAQVTGNSFSIPTVLVYGLLGLFLIVCGLMWNRVRLRIGETLSSSVVRIASDFRCWLILFALPWIYTGWINTLTEIRRNNEIVQLRNDTLAIATVVDRIVMPRRLAKWQQDSIAGFLSQFQAHEYAFRIARTDEAGRYRADIEQALMKGGWKRTEKDPYEYLDVVKEGVSIQFTQTEEHSRIQEDVKNPRADKILLMAFGSARVELTGMGSGGGAKEQDRLLISIGPRVTSSREITPRDGPF